MFFANIFERFIPIINAKIPEIKETTKIRIICLSKILLRISPMNTAEPVLPFLIV